MFPKGNPDLPGMGYCAYVPVLSCCMDALPRGKQKTTSTWSAEMVQDPLIFGGLAGDVHALQLLIDGNKYKALNDYRRWQKNKNCATLKVLSLFFHGVLCAQPIKSLPFMMLPDMPG
jgi:hypothetical protein